MKEHISKDRAKQFVCGHCNEVCSEEHEWEDYRAPYCDTCGAKMNKEETNERI